MSNIEEEIDRILGKSIDVIHIAEKDPRVLPGWIESYHKADIHSLMDSLSEKYDSILQ